MERCQILTVNREQGNCYLYSIDGTISSALHNARYHRAVGRECYTEIFGHGKKEYRTLRISVHEEVPHFTMARGLQNK